VSCSGDECDAESTRVETSDVALVLRVTGRRLDRTQTLSQSTRECPQWLSQWNRLMKTDSLDISDVFEAEDIHSLIRQHSPQLEEHLCVKESSRDIDSRGTDSSPDVYFGIRSSLLASELFVDVHRCRSLLGCVGEESDLSNASGK